MSDDFIPDHTEWVWFWSYNIAAVLMLILCIIHTHKVCQDLLTAERESVAHRKSKPQLTAQYKFIQYLTLCILWLHFGDSFFFGLEMASYSWSHQTCRALNNIGGWFLVIGKGCMYMLFMYRIIISFQGSAFAYNSKLLIAIGWSNVVFAIIVMIITTYLITNYWVFAQDVDEFPNPCFPINDSQIVGFFPITMQVWDLVMNVLSLALFLYPLRRLAALDHDEDASVHRNSTSRHQMHVINYLAIKYSILTFVSFITTMIFWLMVHIAPNEYFLVAFD
eukprot:CAMPEP_0197044502 /NCGR_PEP_ID=MMETSP1384-20130603/20537_1 /TAXON_ID=29189 /ORGANISM="Ammonia sp." /LENGTH=277 /DNA_ID=CAMNT_0042475965 /DNA_START=49 /DNA_END=879 /DNA_ORIENTATION=+